MSVRKKLAWVEENKLTGDHMVVENIVVDVVKKDIRNLHLRVLPPSGQVRVTAPRKLKDSVIRLFVMSKLSWIKKHQMKFESIGNPVVHEFITGEIHYYFGKQHELSVFYHNAPPKVDVYGEGRIDLYVRMGSDRIAREKAMTEWYRAQLKAKIPELIEKWQYIIGVEVDSWTIKKMKTRWGSCMVNSRKICFNLELAKKPVHCLEYIVVHEMTHIRERFHNTRFKTLMDGFMPEWRRYQRELNEMALSGACH